MGLYRVHWVAGAERPRRMRLLLFAELPDRVHGEILSALGSTELIFDGGGGQLAVTVVRDRVAFVGPARPEALERVFGIRVSLEQFVRSLLLGETPTEEYRLTREPVGSGLPSFLELSRADRSVTLKLKRRQRGHASSAALGTGAPPEGLELRPLSELRLVDLPTEGSEEDW